MRRSHYHHTSVLYLCRSSSITSKNKFVQLAILHTLSFALEEKGVIALEKSLSEGLDIVIAGDNDFYSQRAKVSVDHINYRHGPERCHTARFVEPLTHHFFSIENTPIQSTRCATGRRAQDRSRVICCTHHILGYILTPTSLRNHPRRFHRGAKPGQKSCTQSCAVRALLGPGQSRQWVRCFCSSIWQSIVHPL